MRELELTADELISGLLHLAANEIVCVLDSCGVGNAASHLIIAGIVPTSIEEISNDDPEETLAILDEALSGHDHASIFTISYDFGSKLLGIRPTSKTDTPVAEPDIFLARFDVLIIHDYDTGKTWISGNEDKAALIGRRVMENARSTETKFPDARARVTSNFTRSEYLIAIDTIKEQIRSGDTYQANLTQQLKARLPRGLTGETIFWRLRDLHPAPFSAYIGRPNSTVVSASPERFFRVDNACRTITTSPIKGTRPRGKTTSEDDALRDELLASAKDRAENTMIVDLLRNDLGRVCEYGSVVVEKLCDLEIYPSLFHLVSTVSGELREGSRFSDILRAVFPCGSITGAPKISTMQIIERIETAKRGLSMGAIGYYVPGGKFGLPETLDLSVAIRTMVIRDDKATFNVGGGIVIDSDPESEYAETLTKARALLDAIGGILV